jgi:uncharacterized UBP type Zn finger protein
MNWIMEHMEDPDFNDPLPVGSTYIHMYIYKHIHVDLKYNKFILMYV